MDNWHSASNNNRSRTYKSGGSNGGCNFKFTVNGKDIEIDPTTADAKAEDLCPDRADDDPLKTITCPSGGTGYSDYAELLIGEAELVKGDNTLRYTRLGSYNYIVSDLIFEVTPYDHEHVAGENWVDTDDTYHWKNCTHSDGHKMDKAKHDYEGQEWEVVEESTCSKKGTHRRSCKVCGHWQIEEMPLAEHNYVEDTTQAVAPTHTSEGKKVEVCSVCGDVHETVLPKVEHTWGDAGASVGDAVTHSCTGCDAVCYELALPTPQKLKGDVSWNVTGLPAGKYEVHLYACAASTTLTQDIVSGGSGRYQFRFGSEGNYTSPASGTYASYGLGTGENDASCVWTKTLCELTAPEGVAGFTIHYGGQGYSAYINSVRLVKVA